MIEILLTKHKESNQTNKQINRGMAGLNLMYAHVETGMQMIPKREHLQERMTR